MQALITQYYQHTPDFPKEILLPKSTENITYLEKWFEKNVQKKICIYLPQKGKKSRLIELATKNAENYAHITSQKDEKNKEKLKTAFSQINQAL
ncbi:hypothetical protein [Candidatus Venteria ishoeyi]|uniref:hypothetical protein n=1 Tax=Candidatus Venteria ishoeyi TaxID=1899563 RepID=UPI00387E39DC